MRHANRGVTHLAINRIQASLSFYAVCRRRSFWVAVVLTGLLAGCTTFPDTTSSGSTAIRTALPAAPADLDRWRARGKLALRTDDTEETARFEWHRVTAERDIITIARPFPLNRQTVVRDGETLSWWDGDEQRPAPEPEGTLAELLTSLELASAGTWLLGYPPESAAWQVDVAEWQDSAPWSAPARLRLYSKHFIIDALIREWEWEPAP